MFYFILQEFSFCSEVKIETEEYYEDAPESPQWTTTEDDQSYIHEETSENVLESVEGSINSSWSPNHRYENQEHKSIIANNDVKIEIEELEDEGLLLENVTEESSEVSIN